MMKTHNLPDELRTLIERFPNDSRVREMLADAAGFIEQLQMQLDTPDVPEWQGGEITEGHLTYYIEACEKHHCMFLQPGFEVEIARQLLATRRQVEELTIGNALAIADELTSIVFPLSMPAELHPDTRQLVLDTARAMTAKLLKAQVKYGFDNGWKQPPSGSDGDDGRHFWTREDCLTAFYHHLAKGDPLDCINYLAFMRANGWKTEHLVPVGWVPCSPDWIEAGGDCGHAPRIAFGPAGNHYHPAPGTTVCTGETVSVQEAWLACGGNPGITATAEQLISALVAMNEAEDEIEEARGRILSPADWDKVQQLLNAPAEPSQALIDLMSRPRRVQVQVPELTEQDKADRVLRVDFSIEPQAQKSDAVLAAEALADKVEEIARNHDARAARLRQACQPHQCEPHELWLLRVVNNIIDYMAGPGEPIRPHSQR